jgi:hypothetical protein
MTTEVTTIRGVRAIYGTRERGGAVGVIKTEGAVNQLSLDFTSDTITDDALATVVLPAGAIVTEAICQITEAFNLGGTTPTILIGEDGAEVTNGVAISEAQAEATGTYDIIGAAAGEWDPTSSNPNDVNVSIVLGGTTPVFTTNVGAGRVVISYYLLS